MCSSDLDGITAAAHLWAGDVEGARRIAEEALQNLRSAFCTMGSAYMSLTAMAEVFLELLERDRKEGGHDTALHARATEACRAVSAYAARTRIGRPRAYVLEGRLALAEGRNSRAAVQFQRALDWARRLRMPLEEALSHIGLASSLTDSSARAPHREQGALILRKLGARPWGYDSMISATLASEAESTIVT